LLEVVLITTGLFLGIAGESWRESREHRELAEQSLRRFRDEFKANRNEVLRVHDRHIKEADDMRAYLKANGPALMAHMADPTKPIPVPVPDNTTDSAGFGYAAWDVALATQSLAYIDPELVAVIGDTVLHEKLLLKRYEEVLPRLDKAIGGVTRPLDQEPPPCQRINCVTWMRLPHVSFSIAILEAVTSVGGMVNSAPCGFIRS
jgi:hypothetical protein